MKLYVGNLSREMTDAQLKELVVPYGTPDSVTVVMDRDTKESRGFGFVEFSNASEAQAAIKGLNEREVSGKNLIVNEARPQKQTRTS